VVSRCSQPRVLIVDLPLQIVEQVLGLLELTGHHRQLGLVLRDLGAEIRGVPAEELVASSSTLRSRATCSLISTSRRSMASPGPQLGNVERIRSPRRWSHSHHQARPRWQDDRPAAHDG